MLFIHLFAELLHCIAQQLGQNTVDSLHQKDSTETTTHSLTFTPTGNSVSSQLDGEEMQAQAQAETPLPPKTQRTRAQYCFGGDLRGFNNLRKSLHSAITHTLHVKFYSLLWSSGL